MRQPKRRFTGQELDFLALVDKCQKMNIPFEGVLSSDQFKILDLYISGYTLIDISKETGISPVNIQFILMGGKNSVKAKLRRRVNRKPKDVEESSSLKTKPDLLLAISEYDREELNKALEVLTLGNLKSLYKELSTVTSSTEEKK